MRACHDATPDEVRAAVVPLLDLEAAARAMMSKIKEHPIPTQQYGGTVGFSYFWGVSVDEVARIGVYAALGLGEPTSQGGEK